jgi:hypothetical protein
MRGLGGVAAARKGHTPFARKCAASSAFHRGSTGPCELDSSEAQLAKEAHAALAAWLAQRHTSRASWQVRVGLACPTWLLPGPTGSPGRPPCWAEAAAPPATAGLQGTESGARVRARRSCAHAAGCAEGEGRRTQNVYVSPLSSIAACSSRVGAELGSESVTGSEPGPRRKMNCPNVGGDDSPSAEAQAAPEPPAPSCAEWGWDWGFGRQACEDMGDLCRAALAWRGEDEVRAGKRQCGSVAAGQGRRVQRWVSARAVRFLACTCARMMVSMPF